MCMALPSSDDGSIGMVNGVETINAFEVEIVDEGDGSSVVGVGGTRDDCWLCWGHYSLALIGRWSDLAKGRFGYVVF